MSAAGPLYRRRMTTTQIRRLAASLDRHVGENVATMLLRLGMTQTQLATALGLSQPTVSRKIQGRGVWTVHELELCAALFGLEPTQLIGDLPTLAEWCAIRDSNPEPAGLRPEPPLGLYPRHLALVV